MTSDTTSSPRRREVRPRNKGDRQEAQIIEAVIELLETSEIGALSVAQIADRSGVSRTQFYFYFESKYAAVAAALQNVWREVAEQVDALPTSSNEPPSAELIQHVTANMIDLWDRNGGLLKACIYGAAADPQLATVWNDAVNRLYGGLAPWATSLLEEGRITPASTDLPALMDVLQGMSLWMFLSDKTTPQNISLERRMNAARLVWQSAFWGASQTAGQSHD